MLTQIVAPLRFLYDLIVRFVEDDGLAFAGYLAFVAIMSLLPFAVFLFTLLGLIGQQDQGAGIVQFMFRVMPEEVALTLHDPVIQVIGRASTDVLTLSIVVVLWISTSGVEGLRTALNRAYRTPETRNYWWRRMQSLGLVLLFSLLILVGIGCLIVGPVLWDQARAFFDLGLERDSERFPDAIRYGAGGVSLFIVNAALYHALPNNRPTWIGVLPGSAAVCLLIVVATSVFTVYLERFARYAEIYGSLGGIISTMVFFYVLAVIFIVGAELNAMLADRFAGMEEEMGDG